METLVTRKGQITIPVELRRKYRIQKGTKMVITELDNKIVLNVVPSLIDLIGVDAGKIDVQKALEQLDKMRAEDRY